MSKNNTSVLNPVDPANQLDLFKWEKDFDGHVDVWSQEIPPYEDIKSRIITVDIETRGLDPVAVNAYILAIEAKVGDQRFVWSIGFNEDNSFWENLLERERRILEGFITWLEHPNTNIFILTGHNIFNFDIPWIMERCKAHNIHTGFVMKPGWRGRKTEVKNAIMFGKPIEFHNIEHSKFSIVDTMHLVGIADKMKATLDSYGLKYVCGPEGYGLREERTDIEGSEIFECFLKDQEKFFAYLHDDCIDTELLIHYLLPSIYYLLKYIPEINIHHLVISGNGQLWNKIITKHYGTRPDTDIKTTYPGGFTGIQSGVFKNCAKFDMSGMYPSIMLAMRIHSKKDPDLYQLKVLSLIRQERLRLKKLGNEGDKEAQYQQLALKILINSGYGVLGTIGIPFNDMDAAALVCAYGRKILDHMIQHCKHYGGTIVQADTDGVIVQSTELKVLHKSLQDSLPPWCVIDYEDEYDLVWIYKRKNYITYKNGKVSGIGIARKRDKCELYKRYLKYLPQLYTAHQPNGMAAVKAFTNNVVEQIKNRLVSVELLQETKKMVEYKNKDTHSKIAEDLKASPGDKITYYRYDKTEHYLTDKTQQKKTRQVIGYKRVSEFDNDYSTEYYINEIMKFKESKTTGKVTQEGWYQMFVRSITHPVNETSSGVEL